MITLRAGRVPLRDALDRIAQAAGIRLSYAADLLPLTKLVCAEYESVSVGRIFADLLEGTTVTPVAVGADQIALAPGRDATTRRKAEAPPVLEDVGQLERVVVTGIADDAVQRASPIALGVISAGDIAHRGSGSLSAAIDGAVPGLWMWEQSPLSTLARYGSIRGASSFGVSYPKVYVDGIEVANSLLVTHLDPESISRIEIIRGPQGAALYGADAISGVMNIITRQDGTTDGSSRAELRTRGGASASDYSASSVIAQSHSANVRHGNGARSARAGLTATHIGAFIPEAFSRQLSGSAGLRHVDSRSVITGTVRLFAQDSRTPFSPVLSPRPELAGSLASGIGTDSTSRQTVRQYTLGGTATYTWSERWTHSAIVGIDGYTLSNAGTVDAPFPSAADSALLAATGNAMRATVRASSVGQFGNDNASARVTITAEHSVLRDVSTARAPVDGTAPGEATARYSWGGSRSNTGIIGQVSGGFRNALFVTGGLRLERNSSTSGLGDLAALPMLGVSAVRSLGSTTVKLRSAYGRSIRPVQPASRLVSLVGFGGSLLGASLEPEVQSGTEFGADAFFGKHVTLRVTRFDQTASGLVQPVGVAARIPTDSGPRYRHVGYELQNVGSITNRGWELQGSFVHGPWSLGAVYSQVDSRVGELGKYYTGDLMTGDRMLEVPSHTLGLNAGFMKGRWTTSWSLSRASDWINYDRIALLDAIRRGSPGDRPPVGAELRSFWTSYEGVTRLGGSLGLVLSRGMTLTLDGENLLDEQRGEPDNITVLPGRTVSAGLRLSF